MRYKSHLVAGVVAQFITISPVMNKLNTSHNLLMMTSFTCGALLGSVFPDIDEEESFITNRLKTKFHWFFRHRGLFHYPLISFAIFALLNHFALTNGWIVLSAFLHGFIIGEISHFILDTPEGIRWLFPLVKRCMLKITPSKFPTPLSIKMKHFAFDMMILLIVSKLLPIAFHQGP